MPTRWKRDDALGPQSQGFDTGMVPSAFCSFEEWQQDMVYSWLKQTGVFAERRRSLRSAAVCLLGLFGLQFSPLSLAEMRNSDDEVQLAVAEDSILLEESVSLQLADSESTVSARAFIVEEDLFEFGDRPRELTKKVAEVGLLTSNENQISVVVDPGLSALQLEQSRLHFRNVFAFSSSRPKVDTPLFGSLRSEKLTAVGFREPQIRPGKTFSFGESGELVELAGGDVSGLDARFSELGILQSEGWRIQAYPSSGATTVVSKNDQLSKKELNKSLDKLKANSAVVASGASPVPIEIGKSATNFGLLSENKLVTMHGRVVLPTGFHSSDVVIKIAGTSWMVTPDVDGFFEFPDLPAGSRLELVAWHTAGSLVQKLVPVTVSRFEREVMIRLERSSEIDTLAESFGVRQEMQRTGFCGRMSGLNSLAWTGAQVAIRDQYAQVASPAFFNQHHLPDSSLREGSEDGRFCAFNLKTGLVEVSIRLLNGTRRSFRLHLQDTTFDANLDFNMTGSVYRPAEVQELVDGASWIPVREAQLRSDLSYSPVLVDSSLDPGTLRYFPAGQEFNEVRVGEYGSVGRVFELRSREDFVSMGIARCYAGVKAAWFSGACQDTKPLVLRGISDAFISELSNGTEGIQIDHNLGRVLVSLNLSELDLEYENVRLQLRDSWSSEVVGEFRWLPQPEGAQNPKFARGYFVNVPFGQHSLTVTDANGGVKWLDVVRSLPESLQILSVRE